MIDNIYTSPHSSRVYSITLLISQALTFWLSNKTVCLASLGIATVDKEEVMKLVMKGLYQQGIYIEEKTTDYMQWPECWSGSRFLNYYMLTFYKKIAYCSIEKAPAKGFKQLSFLVEESDKTLRLCFDGLTLNEVIEQNNIPAKMTACRILAPENAYIWLSHDDSICWSTSIDGDKKLATSYD